MSVVTIKNLTKHFDDIIAVDHLDLSIEEGTMFGIVGPDGAGKTTTFRMLCGVLSPSEGTAEILGLDLVRDQKKIKREIGYLSQRFSLYGDLTVDENIEFFAEIHEVYDYKARRDELLTFTRLTPFRDRLAEKLSGGMKQKLALAATLIHKPKIIFLDEPTTGVDPVSRRDFWKILSELLTSGITIVMSTPYLDEAERCHRVALMNKGRTMTVDTPQAIKRTLRGTVIEIVVSDVRCAVKALRNHPHIEDVQPFGDRLNVIVHSVENDVPAVEKTLRDAGVTILESHPTSTTLENVFISMMAEPRNE